MKKLLSIIIAILLVIGTISPSLSMHYCGGKIVSISFISKAKACCGGHCPSCKDTKTNYKLKDNFEKQSVEITAPATPDCVVLESQSDFNLLNAYFLSSFTSTQPPPLNRTSSTFTEVFRI